MSDRLSEVAVKIAYLDGLSSPEKAKIWEAELRQYLPNLEFVSLLDKAAIDADIALVWKPPSGRLAQLKSLKVILSLGQGVDHLFCDPDLPTDIPICRIVDPHMSVAMGHWVISCLLDHLRYGPAYRTQQQQHVWQGHDQLDHRQIQVGIYGIGAIGAEVARMIASLGFSVSGWSRSQKALANITCYSGDSGFQDMVSNCDYHVCLLPLTDETNGLFDAAIFAAMKDSAYFINGGRGGHVQEADLLTAIQSGQISGAALDVFQTEPLPVDDPLWDEPRISIFPHVAAQTEPHTAVRQIAYAIADVLDGKAPSNQVTAARGY